MKISYNWLKEYVDVTLPPDELRQLFTMSGLSVESAEKKGQDWLFEIEVTSNRPDWLSVIGVARELAALTGKKLRLPSPRVTAAGRKEILVDIADTRLCPTYTARVIRGVSVGESPAWLVERLDAVGLRPVNNVVDITNFCLFETGEPMHAFDLDKLVGGVVAVRRARKGEKLVTIDGIARELDESMIVIADAVKPVALAGIMGGRETEVTASTKNILLEAASFEPITIRRTSRKCALSTESSYRFERKVAIDTIRFASDRAATLITELAGGEAGGFYEAGERAKRRRTVAFRPSRAEALLGIAIPKARMKKILTGLGMKVAAPSNDVWKLEVPELRNDIGAEVDIIEEVARVYGYDKVPETIPAIVDQPERLEKGRVVDQLVRAVLVANGAREIVSYSLCGRKTLVSAGRPEHDIVEIRNPLSGEQEVMRSSLLPGMLNAILWNCNRKSKDLKLFELGGIYLKEGANTFMESKQLAIGLTGDVVGGWLTPSRAVTFYDLKGQVEVLLRELGIQAYAFAHGTDPGLSDGECAALTINGERAGILGAVRTAVAEAFDIREKVYYCQIDADGLARAAALEKTFKPVSRFPAVLRDISIIAPKEALHAEIVACVTSSAGALLKAVELIDRYTGTQVPEGKVSLTYRLEYHDPARTLEAKEVQDAHGRVLAALEARFGAKLR